MQQPTEIGVMVRLSPTMRAYTLWAETFIAVKVAVSQLEMRLIEEVRCLWSVKGSWAILRTS